ncbi:MAG: hypothetical protein J6X55_03780 [Victivallales bacterium]|nr:hypothetical protein [Victivallales bacterium]
MSQFVINVMSQDRTGIVADVTRAIKNLEGNLEDMTQTVLQGYFTMILIASFPDSVTEESLKDSLANASELTGLGISVTPFVQQHAKDMTPNEDSLYILTSSGPDRTGLVCDVTEALRQKDINIVDLNTRSHNGNYNMMFLLSIPEGTDIGKLKRSLRVTSEVLGLNLELRHQALFRKTNEI